MMTPSQNKITVQIISIHNHVLCSFLEDRTTYIHCESKKQDTAK